jgi:hypothetical protein
MRYSSSSFFASSKPTAALVGAPTSTLPVEMLPTMPPSPPKRRDAFAAALSGFFTYIRA